VKAFIVLKPGFAPSPDLAQDIQSSQDKAFGA